jgi:molybdate transport system permease protein
MTAPALAIRGQVMVGDAHPVEVLSLDLQVPNPGVVAVMGPNAAGKTTLLRAVAGLVDLAAPGRVVVAGTDVTACTPAERDIGYVPQGGTLFGHLSALGNVAYGVRARGASRSTARRRAREVLEQLGVADLADRRPATLSGGQVQRVALARALSGTPRVLLLDEPTAALDAVGRRDVQSLLADLLRSFTGTCLVVTHSAAEAFALASRVVVLEGGRVSQDAAPAELRRAPATPWIEAAVHPGGW